MVEARPSFSRQVTGKAGEDIGTEFLKKRGFRILARNVKTPIGEIDLVAQDGKTLVFVEVKARRSTRFGRPEEAVTFSKQKRLSRLAAWYIMKEKKAHMPVRFDVLSVQFSDQYPSVQLIQNAFESCF